MQIVGEIKCAVYLMVSHLSVERTRGQHSLTSTSRRLHGRDEVEKCGYAHANKDCDWSAVFLHHAYAEQSLLSLCSVRIVVMCCTQLTSPKCASTMHGIEPTFRTHNIGTLPQTSMHEGTHTTMTQNKFLWPADATKALGENDFAQFMQAYYKSSC